MTQESHWQPPKTLNVAVPPGSAPLKQLNCQSYGAKGATERPQLPESRNLFTGRRNSAVPNRTYNTKAIEEDHKSLMIRLSGHYIDEGLQGNGRGGQPGITLGLAGTGGCLPVRAA
jgi:hypothetical protein